MHGCRAWLTEYGIEYSCPTIQFVNQFTNAWGMPCVEGERLCPDTVKAINWGLDALGMPILDSSKPPTLEEAKQLARRLMDIITRQGLQTTFQWSQYYEYLRLLVEFTP